MRVAILIFFSLLVNVCHAQMIDFVEPDWKLALDQAKAEDKLVMVYLNADWCDACIDMELNVFTDEAVAQYFSEQFVNVPFDAEGFPGTEIAERYDAYVYPSFLFVNAYGELVHKSCGWMDSVTFLAFGEEAMTDGSRLIDLKKRFSDGDRTAEFLEELSFAMDMACENTDRLVETFFGEMPKESWTTEAAWMMIKRNVIDIYNPYFQHLLKNKAAYEKLYTKDSVDAKVFDVLLGQFIDIYEGADVTLFANRALEDFMQQYDFAGKSELQHMIDMQYAELVENWSLYGKSVVAVVDEQVVTDVDQLNEFGWMFYLHVLDHDQLVRAISWMKAVIEESPAPASLDIYASLLYKTGSEKEAIKWEKKAIKAAEAAQEDLTHYQLQLARFEMGVH